MILKAMVSVESSELWVHKPRTNPFVNIEIFEVRYYVPLSIISGATLLRLSAKARAALVVTFACFSIHRSSIDIQIATRIHDGDIY